MSTKKNILFTLLTSLIFSFNTYAQNLVINGDFESVITNPSTTGQLNLALPWEPLNASPDLYNVNAVPVSTCDNMGVPNNVGGFTPDNSGGGGYAGIQLDLNNNYREYISCPLSFQLQKDTLYRVEFYAILADSSRYACNRLGMLLTSGIPVQNGTGLINIGGGSAQIETSNIISDTSNWTLITGIYQATGSENYITIGLFRDDNSLALQKQDRGPKNTGCNSFDLSAYYFIDDVVVKPANESIEILGDTILCPGEGTVLYASTNVPYWWSDENNPTDTLSLASFITIIPTVPVKYYLNGLTKIDSVTITFVPAPVLNLGPDTLLCRNDSIKLDAFGSDIYFYDWSTDDTSSFIFVSDTGSYYVDVYNTGCIATDTIVVADFLPNEKLNLGTDSTYCFFIGDSLTLDAGIADNYLWTPTNEITPTIVVQYPSIYNCVVTRPNGCTSSASLEVDEVCEPTFFAPNAFTPDGDGLNDIFNVYANNINSFNLRIQNRRGQTIFYTEDPLKGWDGTFEGTDSPVGVYVYRVNYRGLDFEGSKVKKKILGTVTLVR